MNAPHEYLTARLATIAKLKKLKANVDPGSGMTVRIRRGALATTQNDWDSPDPPDIELEVCTDMEGILDALIATQVTSLSLWERATRKDIAAANHALEALAAAYPSSAGAIK